ncbi:MAG: lipid A export permease/ATP-binding protein MsbA [Burkholderiales bacterium]|nr:lipid A export permease/ATP-binding protein MsbA [Burkholderiales bacterium]
MTRETMDSVTLYKRLLRYVMPYWRVFAAAVASIAIVAATEPAVPALMKPMLDGGFVGKDQTMIRLIPVLIVLIFLVRGVATFTGAYAINWVGNRLVMDLRMDMFGRLIRLPNAFFDDHVSGNLISKITFDVTQVTLAATNVVLISVKDSLIIFGLLGWLVYLNWELTLLTLVMAPLIAFVIRTISKRLRQTSRDTQNAMGEITQVVEEAIECSNVVKLYGGQPYETRRFHESANRVRRFNVKQAAAAAANVPIVQLIASFALAIIVYQATLQSSADKTTVGSFVSFIMAMLMLTSPMKRVTSMSEYLQRGLAAAESIFGLIDEQAEPDEGKLVLDRAQGHLVFEEVRFTYGDESRYALDGFSLDIRPGETIALVGASGSGKSTLANLIPRFYHPTSGRIVLDGHDTRDLTLESLRNNIALVSQNVVLFNDTVAANIAYGSMGGASREKIEAAARAAHALDFILEMPQGLDTLIGENGLKLSGGQRQRLGIARALLRDAPILILDEATSALDSESEKHVQAALEVLMKGRTTVVIAHRLSTIEKANRIVVMQKGKIVEIGTHDELLQLDGAYARLHRIQYESAIQSVSGEMG